MQCIATELCPSQKCIFLANTTICFAWLLCAAGSYLKKRW